MASAIGKKWIPMSRFILFYFTSTLILNCINMFSSWMSWPCHCPIMQYFTACSFMINKNSVSHCSWFLSVFYFQVRICGRMIASGGVYLFYADLVSRSPSRQLRKLSETLIGIYLVCFAYALLNSKEDKAAFIRIVPMGEALLYILTAIIGFCCICFLSGKYIKDGALALAIVATLYTAVIDGNLPYWTKRKNLDYWVQIRLIQEHVCLVLGCVLYHLTFWKRLKQD